jgi:hypothetical protein
VDGIYGSVTGSVFSDDDSVYLYPCDAIIDVSVVFPGYVLVVSSGLFADGG